MEYRSWPARGMSPGTDPAALRLITTAVVVGLVASGVVLAAGRGLMTSGAEAKRPAAGRLARPAAQAQAAGIKLLGRAAEACRSVPYRGTEMAWWGPGGDTSVVEVWHHPGGQALTQAPGTQALTHPPRTPARWFGQSQKPVSLPGSGGPNLGGA